MKPRDKMKELLHKEATLQVTSMMDIFTVMIFFLIQNFASTPEFNLSKGIGLPMSTAKQPNFDTLNIVASQSEITVESNKIAYIKDGKIEGLDSEGVIPPLYKILMENSSKSNKIADMQAAKISQDKTGKYDAKAAYVFDGNIALQADKKLPWSVVKRILKTSAKTPYTLMRFAVIQKPE